MKVYYSLELIKAVIKDLKPTKIVLVSSGYLISKCGWAFIKLAKLSPDKIQIIRVPDGEKAKEWPFLEKLLGKFIKAGLDRKSLVIALGGGSVTDLAGFASSVYQRGIRYINVPTTLLAQVDASIGGKTAINFFGYKNQIGTFHNPAAIIIDSRFLKTLKRKQIIDGLAEIIKAGLIKDRRILEIIKKSNKKIGWNAVSGELILRAIRVKQYFVNKDPEDKNIRQILNFGHTIAHALELKYGLSHGEAVLIGMMEELKIAEKLGETKSEVRIYLKGILDGLDLDLKLLKPDWKYVLHDKKIIGDEISLPVIKKIGEAKLIKIKLKKLISRIG
jgi:3-dehydroquinate synthase